jgi:hypothetical protein
MLAGLSVRIRAIIQEWIETAETPGISDSFAASGVIRRGDHQAPK